MDTALNLDLKTLLAKSADTIRGLSMDAVQKADSGHPGLPMGCAELGAYLYGVLLNYDPKDPNWANRDHFILSAGHGSMLLYSCLHLAGYDLSLEELKNFRQLHSKTPGHPELHETPGVETTTGPLGQGIGNAVGLALGLKALASKFNTEKHKIFSNKVYTLVGDGCMMEGVSSEVSSLAGHLQLDNLIVIYDANQVCLDGPISETLSEDTAKRYEAYGWDVYKIDGNNLDEIAALFNRIKGHQHKPILVMARTVIGKGSPNKAGTSKVHGSPLGAEEVIESKKALGLPEEPFYIPQTVLDFFHEKAAHGAVLKDEWQAQFSAWGRENPELLKDYQTMWDQTVPSNIEEMLKGLAIKAPIAGRKASQDTVSFLAEKLPYLYGGSADLSCSDLTMMKQFPIIARDSFQGRNIKFGVREFGMATMATGLYLTHMIVPFIGTFLTFSDYMRNAVRLASLMKAHVIYQYTHDSIFLGEDGPTHQPIEHYAALRAIPNLHVIRPADSREVKMAWIAALNYKGPTAILLSRQNLPDVTGTDISYADGMGKGAYILKKESGKPDYTLIATGSEVSLAMDVATQLEKMDKKVRVISFPCWELFEQQSKEYKESIFGGDLGIRVSIEAGVAQGWHQYIGRDGIAICMESFGASAPMKTLQKAFGFTVEDILERIL
ncbi:MAG: transketolase [Parachlamydiaceae bacterium]